MILFTNSDFLCDKNKFNIEKEGVKTEVCIFEDSSFVRGKDEREIGARLSDRG